MALGGEVDLHTAPRLDEELFRLIDLGATRVIVDLSDTSFIDSTVLGVLLRAHKRIAGNGGRFVLVTDDPRTRRLFQVTGLDGRFKVASTLIDAFGVAA